MIHFWQKVSDKIVSRSDNLVSEIHNVRINIVSDLCDLQEKLLSNRIDLSISEAVRLNINMVV